MPKILPKANALEERWLAKVIALPPGVELYLLVEDKKEQTTRGKAFRELLAKMDRFDPILASRISIKPTIRDRKMWLVLSLKEDTPLVGYTKNALGEVEEVSVEFDPERPRVIKLMWDDGLSLDEISCLLPYPLTSEECTKLARRKK